MTATAREQGRRARCNTIWQLYTASSPTGVVMVPQSTCACASPDWIDRLAAAAEVATPLQDLGDDLVTECVEHARFASRSWAEIGAALGVTRQGPLSSGSLHRTANTPTSSSARNCVAQCR